MKTTTTVRSLKKEYTATTSGFGKSKQLPTITHVISKGGPVGLRHSLRGSAAGKIWKKTVLGDKFEFSKKLKEKPNYILYTSGMGHEKKEIQEIEQIPQPLEKGKIVEERQLIDNYEYHETKNIKKNKNPRVASITHHARLSAPFERKTVIEYSANTSQQNQPKILSTITVKKEQYNPGKSPYSSLTTRADKNKTIIPPKLFETYKPDNNTRSYSQTKKIITETPVKNNKNKYQTNATTTTTTTTTTKTTTNIKNNEGRRRNVPNVPKNLNKNVPKPKPDNKSPYNRKETEPNNKRGKPESKPNGLPRSGSVPKGGIKPLGRVEKPKKDNKPRSGSKPLDRPKYEPSGPAPKRPGHHGPGTSGKPKPRDSQTKPTKPENKGPKARLGPRGPQKPRQDMPSHHGPHGPEYHGRPGGDHRPRSPKSQPKKRSPYNEKTFPGSANRPYLGKKYPEIPGSQSKGLERPSELNTVILDATPLIILPDEGGDNYNYYESKNILKKHRRLPITLHQRREDFGSTMDIPSKRKRRSSFTYTKKNQQLTNLNKTYSSSKPVITTKYTESTYQTKTKTTSSRQKPVKEPPKKVERPRREQIKTEYPKKVEPPKRVEQPKKELQKKVAPPKREPAKREAIKTVTPKKETVIKSVTRREIGGGAEKGSSSYSEYRRYEQKGNLNNDKNNRSQVNQTDYKKYQLNQSSETRESGLGQYKGRNVSNINNSYEYNQRTEYKYGLPMGAFPQFQIINDEYMIIDCPVHGKQKVRRDRFKKFY